jgi:hypothetical protein
MTCYLLLSAKVEIFVLRVADRPAAIATPKRLKRLALMRWDYEVSSFRWHGKTFVFEHAASYSALSCTTR